MPKPISTSEMEQTQTKCPFIKSGVNSEKMIGMLKRETIKLFKKD